MLSNRNSLTLLFCMQNIHNLFIYKEHWTDNKVMRLVIKEVLLSGQFAISHIGNNPKPHFKKLAEDSKNCAIISITIRELEFSDQSIREVVSMFSEEMANRKNRFLFENNIIDDNRNVTNINVTIHLNTHRRQQLSAAYHAA